MSNEIKNKIEQALELVQEVPSEFRDTAFKVVLTNLLNTVSQSSPPSSLRSVNSNITPNKKTNLRLKDWEIDVIENLPEAHIIAEKGNRDQQTVWAVIKLFSQQKSATPDSVRTTIKDELGITPQNRANTSTRLRDLMPKYLIREKEGKAYKYFPIRNSIKIFTNEDS